MMSIGEFAAACGVTTRTIQRYVHSGKLAPTERTAGGHMRFDKSKVKEFKDTWRDPRGRPRGYSPETVSFMSIGTNLTPAKQDASRFVQQTLARRKLVSRNSCSTDTPSATADLADLL